jgi:hypothetical protein
MLVCNTLINQITYDNFIMIRVSNRWYVCACKMSGVQAPHSRGALQNLVIDSNLKTVVGKFKEMAFSFSRGSYPLLGLLAKTKRSREKVSDPSTRLTWLIVRQINTMTRGNRQEPKDLLSNPRQTKSRGEEMGDR